jgi:hypothetical protein
MIAMVPIEELKILHAVFNDFLPYFLQPGRANWS